ncbi:MAG: class I SAM-dependent methyltransferase [Chloroflexi bacterium]|nr:class I SAM-dependent methyltransferase [Chloroflexota bacterium]
MGNNILTNKEHYDSLYSKTQVQTVVDKAQSFEEFLDDAIQTDTSWHGLYAGNSRNRLKGKRILELGSGDGLNAIIMCLLGGDVTAIDISEVTEKIIKEVNRQVGTSVEALTGDFCLMEFKSESFDFIIGKAFLHHLTHELEFEYLKKVAKLLKREGEARFFEPAMNSKILDFIRWLIPVPGRPSLLNKRAFKEWKDNDPHPERDNSSQHYEKVGKLYFEEVQIAFIGSIERICRLIPAGKFNRRFRRWAHRIETRLPNWFRYLAARSQLIIFRAAHI